MRGGIFPPACPAVLGKAQVLQIGKGDEGHERVSVQAGPGPSLEVAQAEPDPPPGWWTPRIGS